MRVQLLLKNEQSTEANKCFRGRNPVQSQEETHEFQQMSVQTNVF